MRQRDGSTAQPVRRWEPFNEFAELQSRMGQLLETVLLSAPGASSGAWMPLVDIEETDDAWIFEAEVPGVDGKDVNVELHDRELEISGEIKERERKGIVRRRTRRTGRFEFTVTLPSQADPDAVEANVKNGVLTVRVPKPSEAQRHRVEVHSDSESSSSEGSGSSGSESSQSQSSQSESSQSQSSRS